MTRTGEICFFGNYSQYVYTIYGKGAEFHPIVNYRRVDHDAGHQTLSINFDIYKNGDRWDATVSSGGYIQHFEDIENNEIIILLSNV